MSALGQLTLYFEQGGDRQVKLSRTAFKRLDMEDLLEAERGSYDGTFKWSSGVKAIMVLLLRSAAEAIRLGETGSADGSPYVLEGTRPSLAASANDVLTKRPVWVYDVFGTCGGGLPLAAEMIKRRNPDFSVDPASNVELWLDQDSFPASKIEVLLNGRRLTEERELDQLAEAVALQWKPRGQGGKPTGPVLKAGSESAHSVVDSWKSLEQPDPDNMAQHYERMLNLSSDDVEYLCVGAPELGISAECRGKMNVIKAAMAQKSAIEHIEFSLNSVTSGNDQMAFFTKDLVYSNTMKKQVSVHAATQITFREGEIVKLFQMIAPA